MSRVLSIALLWFIVLATVVPAQRPTDSQPRTIAIDARLATDAGLKVGDRVVLSGKPGVGGDTVIVGAVFARGSDPSEVARNEYRVRAHLDQLQRIVNYGDRVDRFAIAAREGRVDEAAARINTAAFGFRAHRSRDVAVETSKTFQVVSRFHDAIGVITIVASAIFLLCIMLLKVDERRRDVAALRLMGISRASVVRSVVIESSLVAMLGSALGVGIGALASWLVNTHYQAVYRTPLVFSLVTTETVTLAVALSLVLGIGAGVLASLRLVSVPPLSLFGR
jgi:putative ABC transport system permease protein